MSCLAVTYTSLLINLAIHNFSFSDSSLLYLISRAWNNFRFLSRPHLKEKKDKKLKQNLRKLGFYTGIHPSLLFFLLISIPAFNIAYWHRKYHSGTICKGVRNPQSSKALSVCEKEEIPNFSLQIIEAQDLKLIQAQILIDFQLEDNKHKE